MESNPFHNPIKITLLVFLFTLTACGGGGSGGSSTPPVTQSSKPTTSSQGLSSTISSVALSSSEPSSLPVPSSEAASSSVASSPSTASSIGLSSSAPSSSSLSSSSRAWSSYAGTLSISLAQQDVYINENVKLSASTSDGEGWTYQWRVLNDNLYQKKDLFSLTWDSSAINENCAPSTFGLRVTGKLYAPKTGLYRFAVAANTKHEFYLQKNGIQQRLTYSNNAVNTSGYFDRAEQQSDTIELQAGESYPFELLYIKSNYQGHFSVLWQQPGNSSWEEIPDTAYSKIEDSVATGFLQQEIFNAPLNTFDELRELDQQLNHSTSNDSRNFTGNSINFQPKAHAPYTIEVVATYENQRASKQISFYPEARLITEDDSNAPLSWKPQSNGFAQLAITDAGDGSANGKVLQINTSTPDHYAEWNSTVRLKPYTAYEVRARVRLLNAPNNLPIPSGMGDSTSWKLPRLRVGVHGDASEQGINARNPSQWRDIAVDFIVPFHGMVDLHAHMGEYTGKFQVDNLRLIKLSGTSVTHFDFPNLSVNIYNDVVNRTGGFAATQKYFTRIAQAATDMRELSGKYSYAQCQKENIFIPRHWSVFAMGTNYNGMILKTPDLLTDDFLRNAWASNNIVGGVMVHELEHSFDFPGSSFGAHLPVLLQAYAMDKRGLLRTLDSNYVDVTQWMEHERKIFGKCISDPGALVPKLFEFQALLPADQKWDAFKKVMHDRWSPYKTEIEGRIWPSNWGSEYEQYRAWWRELNSYTGLDGWELLHTSAERQQIETMYQRKSPIFELKDPTSVAASGLFLWEAKRKNTSVGWGELDTNIVYVDNTCNDKSIYAHAPSKITFQLNKKWQTFDTGAFIKNDSQWGLVSARILGDNTELYRSSAFDARTPVTKSPVLDVSNINELTLEFLDMGDSNSDWSVWVNPRLLRNAAATALLRPSGRIIRHASGKCVWGDSSAGLDGSPLVLSDNCSTNNAKFVLLASGSILHMGSGRCLMPTGEVTNPSDGTRLTLSLSCIDKNASLFDHSLQQYIVQRTSLSCAQPGTEMVNGETVLVLSKQNCSGINTQFKWE